MGVVGACAKENAGDAANTRAVPSDAKAIFLSMNIVKAAPNNLQIVAYFRLLSRAFFGILGIGHGDLH